MEAAHFAIRYNSKIKSFDQRKKAKTKGVVAIKAVAHKLCRASYYIMRDRVPFNKRSHFAGGVLTPPLTKGDAIAPFGNPTIMFPPQEAGLT